MLVSIIRHTKEGNMVDKVVDMAVIHKITELTDAVQTLGENDKEEVYCIKELTKMVMDLDKRVKVLEQELFSLSCQVVRMID
jgi:hypothetical protein